MTIEDSTLVIFEPFLLGYCNCNCGGQLKNLIRKKKIVQYIRGHYKSFARGEDSSHWKGGITYDSYGYTLIRKPDHPHSFRGYVFEHRLVMEQHIDRYLEPEEIVHHINEIKTDNRIENLFLTNRIDHPKEHKKDMSNRFCLKCDTKESIKNGKADWIKYENGHICRKCYQKNYDRERYINNRDELIRKRKEYADRNKEHTREYKKKWAEKNRDKIKIRLRKYYLEHKDKY